MTKKSAIIYRAQHRRIEMMEIEVSMHLAEYYMKRAKRLLVDYLVRQDHAPYEENQRYAPSDE